MGCYLMNMPAQSILTTPCLLKNRVSPCGYVDTVIPAVLTFLQVQTYIFDRSHEKNPSENPVVRICPRVFKGMGLSVF